MRIFDDGTGNGGSVIFLEKKDGQALVAALEFATKNKKELAESRPLPKMSRAHRVATYIAKNLAAF